jgi:hypothetical protein
MQAPIPTQPITTRGSELGSGIASGSGSVFSPLTVIEVIKFIVIEYVDAMGESTVKSNVSTKLVGVFAPDVSVGSLNQFSVISDPPAFRTSAAAIASGLELIFDDTDPLMITPAIDWLTILIASMAGSESHALLSMQTSVADVEDVPASSTRAENSSEAYADGVNTPIAVRQKKPRRMGLKSDLP